MTKRMLFVLSEWGYWGEELIGPLEACDAAGYEVTFLTPTGRKPTPLGSSTTPGFLDPPLGRSVTSPEMAEKTRRIDDSTRLDQPRNLSEWFPRRPSPSSPTYLRDTEAYYARRQAIRNADLGPIDALVIVGGSGAMVDLEYILRDAVGPDGEFIGNVGRPASVIVDWPFLTSRSTESSVECGRIMVEVLERGLRRYGW
jgi:putative intracellular protease/amidase